MPYITDDLNSLETYSILVSLVTIYAGLYYLTNDLGIQGEIILFIIILIFNLLFIQLWIRKAVIMLTNLLIFTFPKLKYKLQGTCIEKYLVIKSEDLKSIENEGDQINENVSREHEVNYEIPTGNIAGRYLKDDINFSEDEIQTSGLKKVRYSSSEENEASQVDQAVENSISEISSAQDANSLPEEGEINIHEAFRANRSSRFPSSEEPLLTSETS
jgi:hypothetical protein